MYLQTGRINAIAETVGEELAQNTHQVREAGGVCEGWGVGWVRKSMHTEMLTVVAFPTMPAYLSYISIGADPIPVPK